MARLGNVDVEDLRDWLEHVERAESTKWLMLSIALERGVDVETLSEWYGVSEREILDWVEALESGQLVTSIAQTEGIDLDELAHRYGVSTSTIRDWFGELESESAEEARDLITRYSQQRSTPVFRRTKSRVTYLDYAAIEEHGWSVDEDDLFEKAARADLDADRYGRVLVDPGESILEAAESRGFSWPYACRAGACANCAALVVEGDVAMPGNNILTDEQVDVLNARLTCVGVPVTEDVKLITNVQHLDQFSDLRLPSPLGG